MNKKEVAVSKNLAIEKRSRVSKYLSVKQRSRVSKKMIFGNDINRDGNYNNRV